MKYLVLIFSIFIVFIVGQVMMSYFSLFGVAPNLLLLLIIILSFDEKTWDFLFVTILGGLLLDFASGFPVGAYLLSFLAVGLILHIISTRIHLFNYKLLPLIIIIALLITDAWLYIYIFLVGVFKLTTITLSYQIFGESIIWQVLYNLVAFLPIYGLSLVLQNVLLNVEQRKKGATLI